VSEYGTFASPPTSWGQAHGMQFPADERRLSPPCMKSAFICAQDSISVNLRELVFIASSLIRSNHSKQLQCM